MVGQLHDVAPLARHMPHHGVLALGEGAAQLRASQVQVSPWAQGHHQVNRAFGMEQQGALKIGHGSGQARGLRKVG